MIIKNAVRCKHCGDVIESKYRYDFVTCSCGKTSVDGGHDYLRRCFVPLSENDNGYESLSICVPDEKGKEPSATELPQIVQTVQKEPT